MSLMPTRVRHLMPVLAGLTMLGAVSIAGQTAGPDTTSRFFVVFRGVRIGSETVTVTLTPGAYTIAARGQIGAPLDLVTDKFEMVYTPDWQPRALTVQASLHGQPLEISTTFGLTTAVNDILQGDRRVRVQHDVSPRALVLPPSYFAAYEAAAARLPGLKAGAQLPAYIPAEGQVPATLVRVTPRRIVTPEATVDVREYELTLARTAASTTVLVWVDDRNRLAKVVFGDQGFAAIREDIGSVMAREEKIRNPGDSDVFIPASSFSLAATVTRPAAPAARYPAVILVGGQGRQDRDETHYGVSIFGQLAGRLAEAGYLVVRYDKRGVGQSGGRPEHAGVAEYAADLGDVVTWLRKRKDVDAGRVFVVAHADGSALALTAAAGDNRVRGVGLLAAPGLSGQATVLAEQRTLLDRLKVPPADRDARMALQQKIIDATITGKGWDTIPADLRRQADSEWFRTWLLFDPAVPIRKMKQPLLVLHGALDQEILPSNADRLEQLGSARKGLPPAATRKAILTGVNHLLLDASTGAPDEYDSLPAQTLSSTVVSALVDWLNHTGK